MAKLTKRTKVIAKSKKSLSPTLHKVLSFFNPVNRDYLGEELKFSYNNKNESPTFQTLPGGLLSIFVTICTLFIAMTSILNFRDRTSPVVSVSTQYQFDPPDFDLYEQSLLPPIALSYLNGIIPPSAIPSFVTIKLVVQLVETDKATGIPVYQHEVSVDFVPCSTLKDRTLLEAIKKANPVSFDLINQWAVCPDTKELDKRIKSSGRFEKPPFRSVLIQVLPCSLLDQSLCRPMSQMKGVSLTHVNVRRAFDGSNYENPITSLPEFDGTISIDTRSTKLSHFKLRKNMIWNDKYDFFGNSLKEEFDDYFVFGTDSRERDSNQIYCPPAQISNLLARQCQPYVIITYQGTGETKVVTRTYPKLFATLGEVGGAGEVVVILATLIYSYYNQKRLEESLREELLGGLSLSQVAGYFEEKSSEKDIQARRKAGLTCEEIDKKSKKKQSINQARQQGGRESYGYGQEAKDQKEEVQIIEDPKQNGQSWDLEDIQQSDISREGQDFGISKNLYHQNEEKVQQFGVMENKTPQSPFEDENGSFFMQTAKKKLLNNKTRNNKISENSKKLLKKTSSQLKELIDDSISSHQNGVNLYKRMDQMDLVQALLFEQHDLVLLPLVLLNLRKEEENQRKLTENSDSGLIRIKEGAIDTMMSPEDALECLVNSTPSTELKATVKRFMLENLPSHFRELAAQTQTNSDQYGVNIFKFEEGNEEEGVAPHLRQSLFQGNAKDSKRENGLNESIKQASEQQKAFAKRRNSQNTRNMRFGSIRQEYPHNRTLNKGIRDSSDGQPIPKVSASRLKKPTQSRPKIK